jgi:hypothetical protein
MPTPLQLTSASVLNVAADLGGERDPVQPDESNLALADALPGMKPGGD